MASNSDYSILIVDDEVDLAELCADAFDFEGFKVKYALNGKEALDILEKEKFHVVISDENMPVMSGHELLKNIQTKKIDVLFYFVTGSLVATEKDFISKGAQGLLSKPYNLDVMIEKIKKDLFPNS